jgi:hypothetical protein
MDWQLSCYSTFATMGRVDHFIVLPPENCRLRTGRTEITATIAART